VAFFGVSAVVLGMAETHGFPLLAVIAWALALLFVPLSRLTIAPNAWPIRPDGRPAALTQVAAGLAVVASLPVSGLVLSATLLAGMVLMPP
jgi:hypothetical protein